VVGCYQPFAENTRMNTPIPPNGRLEVRDANGQVVGYFVPADDLARLDRELESVRRERDTFERHLRSVLPAATPEQEEEFRRQLAEGVWVDGLAAIDSIIAELESGRG
jgi:hypothetical protein